MTNKTQLEWVRSELVRKGKVSRNKAIREQYLTRLSTYIYQLRAEGMNIEGKRVEEKGGVNYYYYLVK